MVTQRDARKSFQEWKQTGELKADKETLSMMIKMMVYIVDSAIGIQEYSLMVNDAISCRYKLEDIYKARYGEPWRVSDD